MSTETLGRRLFLLRVGSGLSQQKVADGINAATGKRINKSMISRWENPRIPWKRNTGRRNEQ